MKKYLITIIETREKEIEVSADNITDAFDIAREQYNNEEITFDKSCHSDTTFKAMGLNGRDHER